MPSISSRGYIFIGLNAVRLLSVVSIILVFCSTIVVMANNIKAVNAFEAAQGSNDTDIMEDCEYIMGSTVPHQAAGIFWSVVSSLFLIGQSIVLFLSECEWPVFFFDRYFPVLGSGFGLGPLGIFQCLMGAQILSHHVDNFTLVSAFLLFSLGCLNMLLGLVFREGAKRKRSITSWREDSKGILPSISDPRPEFKAPPLGSLTTMFTGSSGKPASNAHDSWTSQEKASLGFGRQGEKAAGLRGFILQRPEESLPRYAAPPPPPPAPPVPAFPETVSFPAPEPETPAYSHGNKSKSMMTTSSSFCSPYRKSCQTALTARTDGDDESMYAPTTPEHDAPTFKSSRTAL